MKILAFALGAALSLSALHAGAVGSLADVTIHDRATGRTLPTYYADGRWYVAGTPGNRYEVRVRNTAGTDLLSVMAVDGVNVITGETAAQSQSGYVVAPGTTLPVKGWRKDMTRVAAFTFTRLEDSYAARTGRPDHVGVIGVALFRRKPEPPPVAYEEEKSRMEAPRSGAGRDAAGTSSAPARRERADAPRAEKRIGTGHGRIEAAEARYTTFERESEVPNETITIYYDSRENLAARGILPAPQPVDPQPFPAGFVPDPPRS